MPLSQAQFNAFLAHIQKHGKPNSGVCPMCGDQGWSVEGPIATLNYGPTGFSQGGIPMLVLTCRTCFYVRHFAWLPILASMQSG